MATVDPVPSETSSAFAQNVTAPPSAAKYWRAGISAVASAEARWSAALCEKTDSEAEPSCEARMIWGVSPSRGQRTE